MKQERQLQYSVLEWLKWQRDCVVMEIDTQGIFDRKKNIFRPKKANGGSLFYRGVADILILHKRLGFLALELKSEKGRQNDNQKDFQKAWEAIGGKYYIIKSIDEVIQIFKEKLPPKKVDFIWRKYYGGSLDVSNQNKFTVLTHGNNCFIQFGLVSD